MLPKMVAALLSLSACAAPSADSPGAIVEATAPSSGEPDGTERGAHASIEATGFAFVELAEHPRAASDTSNEPSLELDRDRFILEFKKPDAS